MWGRWRGPDRPTSEGDGNGLPGEVREVDVPATGEEEEEEERGVGDDNKGKSCYHNWTFEEPFLPICESSLRLWSPFVTIAASIVKGIKGSERKKEEKRALTVGFSIWFCTYRFSKHNSADSGFPVSNHVNPFDSDDEFDTKKIREASARTSSEPSLVASNLSSNPLMMMKLKEPHQLNGLLILQQETETTKSVNGCLKIAEEMREDATKTLVTLHQQGEQITRTHMVAADMDHDLSRGEKLLGSLGGIFSKTWKPKKTRPITGPLITRDDAVYRKGNHLEQRERLGLTSASKERSHTRKQPSEPTNALQKVEVEKVKQDDALADLSNILGELRIWIDISEIERQNKALDHVEDDVEVLNIRVQGANQRTRRLLGK
ncbi:SNAP25 homologous protein SNAP33 [Sesamum angolense]|uniref:SNAP25 homologous protein SNAP33 n=1 Tax=Sesamum angolense TaxID=2727404 RepID=A0AAE1WYW6_9LAMI|nr:SNAP25 homologous protein SNAP33 [Sesamum angolense]